MVTIFQILAGRFTKDTAVFHIFCMQFLQNNPVLFDDNEKSATLDASTCGIYLFLAITL